MLPTYLLLFIINPFLGTAVFGITLANNKAHKESYFYIFYFLLASFLGLINITKVPESDLAYHGAHYLSVGNMSLIKYLSLNGGKEFVFYSLNYFIFHVTGASFKGWVFTISLLGYFPFFVAIHRFHSNKKLNGQIAILSVCIAAFFPQLFSLSAHLIRQFIAGSFALLFIVEKLVYKKNRWWIPLFAIFIHSSSIILVLVGFLPFFKERFSKKNAWKFVLLCCVLGVYQYIASSLLPYFSDSSLGYALSRASRDTNFELGSFGYSNYAFILILVFFVVRYVYTTQVELRDEGLIAICNVIFVQIFFIMLNVNQSELSNRLFFFLCYFFPLIIPLGLQIRKYKALRISAILAVVLFFIFRIENGTWIYSSSLYLVTSDLFEFLSRDEFRL